MPVGVLIVDDPSPSGDGLPVMDVPVFVGFAARGPLQRPVAVDSAAGFEAVFGGLLDLVQGGQGEDPAERLTAHLQPAVAAFFAGGGRRCHVIRVAGPGAASARFQVPGLYLVRRVGGSWQVAPDEFELQAASPGAWADRLTLSARLRSQALQGTDLLAPGDLLRVRQPGSPLTGWACVTQHTSLADALAPPPHKPPLRPLQWLWPDGGADRVQLAEWLFERVQIDLAVRAPGEPALRLEACGLAAGASPLPWWGPDADTAFDAGLDLGGWPLAGLGRPPEVDWMLLPRGVAEAFDLWRPARTDGRDALERHGLADFGASLFVDPDWREGLRGPLLLSWADELRFFGSTPRRLQGLHGALGRDDACASEASWLVLPDAVHPGWRRSSPLPARDIVATTTLDPVCSCPPSTFDGCTPPPLLPPQPPRLAFIPAPTGSPAVLPADTDLTLRLRADPADTGGPQRIELQLAAQPDFSDARTVADAVPSADLTLRLAAGSWWLRARAHRAGLLSGWSTPAELDARATGWRALPQADPGVIDTVHRAALALGAASREHVALLSLPLGWTSTELAAHIALLRDEAATVDTATAASAASFAAVHHPWLLQRDADDRLRAHPPAGALMGLLARRSRLKGAWGAPGADPLTGALALAGELQSPDLLEGLGANPLALRTDPAGSGIAAIRSQTLSLDADWSAIGVRRLFILLRRLCRREGQRFVFEPNDLTLRRGLERSFDALLHRLMQRGAFRGADAASSYLLKTASGAEAAREIERGECSLLIQVAPSRPLRFLTLHLRRSGEQLVIEER